MCLIRHLKREKNRLLGDPDTGDYISDTGKHKRVINEQGLNEVQLKCVDSSFHVNRSDWVYDHSSTGHKRVYSLISGVPVKFGASGMVKYKQIGCNMPISC